MPHFKPRFIKTADDASTVTIYRDPSGGWFVGRPGDDLAYHPTPMGAFATAVFAMRWADSHFPGGRWETRGRWRALNAPDQRESEVDGGVAAGSNGRPVTNGAT